jgi:FKBP-type peptidyl-prolyl cis-trans isomerase 2
MEEGEKRTITVTPEEAFGERQNELVTAVNKSALPDNIVSTLGQLVQLKGTDGRIVDVRIIGITEDMVVLDANHPLAGHTLKFEINMIEIKLFFNRINRRNIMLTVTENAEEKLKEHLQTKTDDPEIAIRLVASHSKSARLSLVLDKEQKGDKVLLISPDLASELKDLVIDYQETPQGSAFTISSPASST